MSLIIFDTYMLHFPYIINVYVDLELNKNNSVYSHRHQTQTNTFLGNV